ncbi:MAG: hypothetical protein ABI298_04550, partial [Acidimicrobiales bacterium]
GSPSKLVWSTQPIGGVIETSAFPTQPALYVEDANGNVVTSDTGNVTLAINNYTATNGGATQGTLACANNPISAVAGVAAFTGCKITGAAGDGTYTLIATRSGLSSSPGSSTVSIIAGVVSASTSTVTATPTNLSTGQSSTVTVTLLDANGNGVAGKSVTLGHTGSASIANPNPATTGTTGAISFTVNDSTPEAVTFSATDTTDTLSITHSGAVRWS